MADRPSLGTKQIDAFLSQLSPWDMLYLRDRVRNTEIKGLKQMEDLPMDLVCQVAEWLEPESLITATAVSRTWREMFSSEMVLNMACKSLFPGLRESRPECTDLLGLFQKTIQRYRRTFEYNKRRPSGMPIIGELNGIEGFYSGGERSNAGNGARDGSKPLTVYSHGNLAFQLKDETKVVDVRSGSIRKYVVPTDRRKPRGSERLVAMSKDLLVVSQSSTSPTTNRLAHSRLLYVLIC